MTAEPTATHDCIPGPETRSERRPGASPALVMPVLVWVAKRPERLANREETRLERSRGMHLHTQN